MLKQVVDEDPSIPSNAGPASLEPTDSELLMRFVRHQAHDAFEQLVARHAGMVMGVCTQILRDRHDAEDAFQATFLTLAQRAHKIQRASSVGAWLHKVAYRTAMRAAKRRQLRREHSLDETESAAVEPWIRITQQEQQQALHEELSRLPEQYRGPLVLCYLEGMTRGEAAEKLETTDDSIKHRVARGKRMLRMRLVRRGIMISAAFATVTTSSTTCSAATLSSLVAITTETCTSAVLHGSKTVFSTTIGSLAQEGVTAMIRTTQYRVAAVAALAIGVGIVVSFSLIPDTLAQERNAKAGRVVTVDVADDQADRHEWTSPRITVAPVGEVVPELATDFLVNADLSEEEEKIAESRETWESVKEECGGNYEYSIVLTSEEGGFGSETSIVVRDGEVTERRYRGFRLRQPKPAWEWTETGDALGTHGGAAALKTLDELYDQAETIAAMELEPHQRRYIGLDNRGLLRTCCWFDRRIADDDNGNGVNIGSITLGE